MVTTSFTLTGYKSYSPGILNRMSPIDNAAFPLAGPIQALALRFELEVLKSWDVKRSNLFSSCDFTKNGSLPANMFDSTLPRGHIVKLALTDKSIHTVSFYPSDSAKTQTLFFRQTFRESLNWTQDNSDFKAFNARKPTGAMIEGFLKPYPSFSSPFFPHDPSFEQLTPTLLFSKTDIPDDLDVIIKEMVILFFEEDQDALQLAITQTSGKKHHFIKIL